ncbi:MAG: Mur ligase domain-containing protein [Gallionellaceae bacterium]|nr:Mur ligase domain-containing protein [Gallionellaceae bacterium]
MMLLSQAAKALDAHMIGTDVRFAAVSTDSRKVKAGDLFIALRGENFDGYDFAASAIQDGAAAVMVNADSYEANPPIHDPLSPPILLVKDTRLALGQ